MKPYAQLLMIFFTLVSLKSVACLNFYVIDSSGHRHLHEDYPPSSIYTFPKYEIEKLKSLEQKIPTVAENEKFKYISDYCAYLIKLGRYKEAVPILERLLQEKPNEYTLNANLAVAYELDGQLEKALSALNRSLEIYPKAHNESEWFHQRILEAAINVKDNKITLQDTSILKLEGEKSYKTIGYQISHQLKERIPLSKSTNNLLSKAIEESADFYGAHISLEWAIELYAIAIGYTNDDSVKLRLRNKINSSRKKLVYFKNKGKEGSESKYLLKANWKDKINQIIKEWQNYSPYYYDKEIQTSFN
jgi:tetratricopeptide (TPR) repeat protein